MDAYPVSAEAGTMEEIQTMASNIAIVCKIDGTGTTDVVTVHSMHLLPTSSIVPFESSLAVTAKPPLQ